MSCVPELLLLECFRLVNFWFFSYIGRKICLVLCVLEVDLIYLVVFVCIRRCYVRIYGNSYTSF